MTLASTTNLSSWNIIIHTLTWCYYCDTKSISHIQLIQTIHYFRKEPKSNQTNTLYSLTRGHFAINFNKFFKKEIHKEYLQQSNNPHICTTPSKTNHLQIRIESSLYNGKGKSIGPGFSPQADSSWHTSVFTVLVSLNTSKYICSDFLFFGRGCSSRNLHTSATNPQ